MLDFDIVIAKNTDAKDACNVLYRSIKEICAKDYQDLDDNFIEKWLSNKTPQNIELWIKDRSNIFLIAKTYSDKTIGVASLDKKELSFYVMYYLNT